MIISRKRFEQELQKVRDEMWDRQVRDHENESLWRAIHKLEERVDNVECTTNRRVRRKQECLKGGNK